jgi:outer membrane protein OmpA-like peptidoglycan-associated protein
MDLDSSYDWHPGAAGGSTWFKPWMIVAIVLSGAVHGGLYYWFRQTEVPREAAPTRAAIETLKDIKVQGVLNTPLETPETASPDTADLADLAQPKVVELPPDPYDLQKALPETVEIRTTPNAELPPIPGAGGAVGPADVASVLAQDSAELAAELERITKAMMARAPKASDKQLEVSTGVGDEDLLGEDELIKAYNDTLAKMSKAGDEVTQGFSDLDELLTRTGPILDETKPILMPTDLLFGYNQDQLQESARLSLMKLGLLIQKNPRSTFVIEGHTDTTGSPEYNMLLSQRRAQSVQAWLAEALSISSGRIRIEAFGETRPLANPGGTKEEQAINRRVEIVIKPPRATPAGAAAAPRATAVP